MRRVRRSGACTKLEVRVLSPGHLDLAASDLASGGLSTEFVTVKRLSG